MTPLPAVGAGGVLAHQADALAGLLEVHAMTHALEVEMHIAAYRGVEGARCLRGRSHLRGRVGAVGSVAQQLAEPGDGEVTSGVGGMRAHLHLARGRSAHEVGEAGRRWRGQVTGPGFGFGAHHDVVASAQIGHRRGHRLPGAAINHRHRPRLAAGNEAQRPRPAAGMETKGAVGTRRDDRLCDQIMVHDSPSNRGQTAPATST